MRPFRDCAGWVFVALVIAATVLLVLLIADLPLPDGWIRISRLRG